MKPVRRGTRELALGSDFFATPLREAVALLRAGLARDDPLLLLTGAAGTGKTTVARHLLEALDPQRYALGGVFGSFGEGDSLMSLVVQDLGVRPHGPGDAFHTLEQFLQRQEDAGREAVLVIDEAQALDADALRLLWQLALPLAGVQPRLHVVLVAQQLPDAVTELTRGGRMPPIGTHCHLRVLKEAETREFVLNRIRSGSGIGQPAFGNDALDAIHERSGGVLRRISQLCDRIVLSLAMEGPREVSAQVVAAVEAQLQAELSGSGVPVREQAPTVALNQASATRAALHDAVGPAGNGLAAARSSTLDPVSTSDALSHPFASAPSDPNVVERPNVPVGTAAPHRVFGLKHWPALRQGRLPTMLFAGLLLLVALALLGLARPWLLRGTMPGPARDPAAHGSNVQVPDRTVSPAQGPASTIALPSAAPVASTVPPSRSEAGLAMLPATLADPLMVSAAAAAPTPAPTPCSGPADTLGLCGASGPPLRGAPYGGPAAAPVATRTQPSSCTSERGALGLCDTR